jgi:hypothetical protein
MRMDNGTRITKRMNYRTKLALVTKEIKAAALRNNDFSLSRFECAELASFILERNCSDLDLALRDAATPYILKDGKVRY